MAHRIARIDRHINPPPFSLHVDPFTGNWVHQVMPYAVPVASYLATRFKDWAYEKGVEYTRNAYRDFVKSRRGKTALRGYYQKKKIYRISKMPRTKRSYKKKPSSSKKYSSIVRGQRVYQRSARRRTRRRTSLKKDVKALKALVKADQATHTYKELGSGEVQALVGQVEYGQEAITSVSNLESWIANLRYYNPAVPGTLTTASGATGTFHREIHFANVYSRVEVRNNYQVPCRLKIYLAKPKSDTSITPLTYYTNGIADQVISAGADQQTAGLYLTDIVTFNEQYSLVCKKDIILDAGAMCSVTHNTGRFNYDPSLTDSHSSGYQTKYKSCLWLIRVEGVLGHDSASAQEFNTLLASIDYQFIHIAKIEYDAGTGLNDIYIADNRASTFTSGSGVVTSKPVADNIGYSTN